MYLIKTVILILITLFNLHQLKCQVNYIVVGEKYPVVKLCLNNYQIFKVKNFTQINDSIIGFDNYESGVHETLSIKSVKFLSEKNGSYALTYGLIGAGIGLSSVLITQTISKPEDFNWGPYYIGFTLGFAAVGAVMGAFMPKWRTLKFKMNQTSYTMNITPIVNQNNYGVVLKFNLYHH